MSSIHTVARRELGAGGGWVGGAGGERGGGAEGERGRRESGERRPAVVHTRADLRDDAARRALEGVDVLFHVGFQLWLGAGGVAAMASANLEGTANVLAARPARVILLSSAAVYGAWPDNALPLTEAATARPNPECAYAGQKLAVERMCADAAPTTSLRVAAVLGPDADPLVHRVVRGYRYLVPAVAGVTQALQFVHQDDVVSACLAALRGADADGVFNVAPPDWLDAPAVAAVAGGRVLALPRRVLLGSSRVGARLGVLPFGVDRSVLITGPLALDPSAAGRRLRWRATRSSAQTLEEMLAGGAGWAAARSGAT